MPCKGSDMHSDVWGDDSPCASTDQKDDLDREWRSRQEKFKNEGYREGFDAGKEVTVQEGFDNGYTKGTHAGYEWGFMQGFLSALECIRKTKPAYLPNPSSSTTTEKLSTQLSSLPPQQTLETICATIHASSNYNSSSVSTTTYTTPPSSSSNSRNENLKGLIDQVKVDTMDFLQNTLNIAITRHTSIS